ncbi:hypothetical protein [Fusibacter sp. JL216-2]|uniref:hypothetical protein n=1 Tax=Fusibacter sp. JL216-2 TaxID=3071453 RepID=UPI003D3439BE
MKTKYKVALLILMIIFSLSIYNIFKYAYAFDLDSVINSTITIDTLEARVTDIWKEGNKVLLIYETKNEKKPFGYALFTKHVFFNKYKINFHYENDGRETYDTAQAGQAKYVFKFHNGNYYIVNETPSKGLSSIIITGLISAVIVIIYLLKTKKWA